MTERLGAAAWLKSELLQRQGVRLSCGTETVVLLVGTHCLSGGIVPLSVRFLLVVASSCQGVLNFKHAGRFDRPLATRHLARDFLERDAVFFWVEVLRKIDAGLCSPFWELFDSTLSVLRGGLRRCLEGGRKDQFETIDNYQTCQSEMQLLQKDFLQEAPWFHSKAPSNLHRLPFDRASGKV